MPLSLHEWIRTNRMKSFLLVLSLPLILGIVVFLAFYQGALETWMSNEAVINAALDWTMNFLSVCVPILLIWLAIAFFCQKKIMFSFSWARELTRKENPELYNIVENLCITRWLPTPKIWIIEDNWMNAFAVWWRMKDSWVCFTRWLINNLDKKEIEAVAWHELTHIINKDSLLMAITILYIGIVWTIWREIYYRSSDEKTRKLWLAFVILWYAFYPLIRLAISRKREYLADAGSVVLTHDNQAMISALRKIWQNSTVNLKNDSIASLFIENPLTWGSLSTLFQTHPSIEDRIKALEHY
jgi:heat shock protein HtpX